MEYTVYKHTTPCGKVYVGCCKDVKRRWNGGHGYKKNDMFYDAIQRYGWSNIEHEILATGLSLEEAYAVEKEMIRKFNSNNPKHGFNLTDGGETGKKYNDSVIVKMSEVGKINAAGERNPRYGKHCTEETKKRISDALKGKMAGKLNPNFGKPMTDEQRKKLSESRKGRHYPKLSEAMKKSEIIKANSEKRMIRVNQYTKDGEYVKTWRCAPDAAEALCGRRAGQSNIASCANGKLGNAYGFVWRYEEVV